MVSIRQATSSDIPAIITLTKAVFDTFVAPSYSAEGNAEFYKYLSSEAFHERLGSNHFILLAYQEEHLAGLIEIRNYDHVSLFFVESSYQKQGIGRALFNEALDRIQTNNPTCLEISVNSSPNAVMTYEKLGFQKTADEKETNGIKYVPMKMELEK
jgi:ribosomal protein S18 acetylase RimI-like enzyme